MTTTTPYSFYFNIIVLSSNAAPSNPSTPASKSKEKKESPTNIEKEAITTLVSTAGPVNTNSIQAIFSGHKIVNTKSNNAFEKMAQKANNFIASKTMISRATAAFHDVIPKLMDEFQKNISIQKRFHQGPVYVLEVSVLPTKISTLLQSVKGQEAADNYIRAKESLEALNCQETLKVLENDVITQINQFVKEKLIEIVPEKVNEECKGGNLEIECIALEDKEEARWLYSFLEFNAEMMKDAKI